MSFNPAFDTLDPLNQVAVPDLWQQQAVAALREGRDVVVQAPTGAGKTLVFELWSNQGKSRGQAVYTVPTRALANDKLAEWRARGWDVGIATGDLSENLGAPVVVATLETQKFRLLNGDGPALLVVDEYQMLADPDRGLNYELALALAPPQTQLLLLSGSVANPQDVVKWLLRLGRKAVLVRHDHRPVPLEEVHASQMSYHVPSEIRGYWPRLVAKALAEDLGPLLIFAPRRRAAESLANELSHQLPNPHPLPLTTAQKLACGDHLSRLLKTRVAYHHSGLSYAARAGVVEPLAKAGQLRVVVATMGLAAGINFSLRSVALAGESYRRDAVEQLIKPDELLQMFGRAGRRGLDETGFVIITANELRLIDSHPAQLMRNGAVDWGALLGLMATAASQGRDPYQAAVRAQERLFTTKPIVLGVEHSLRHPGVPCGLNTDAERARHVRKPVLQFLNSQGGWEPCHEPRSRPLRDIFAHDVSAPPPVEGAAGPPRLIPALSLPAALEKAGRGELRELPAEGPAKIHGRALTVADQLADGQVLLAKWVRRLTNWSRKQVTAEAWRDQVVPLLRDQLAAQKTPLVALEEGGGRITALLSLADWTMRVPIDRHGVALWRPPEREVLPEDCARCTQVEACRALAPGNAAALLWRRLGLVDPRGVPGFRGRIVSFFSQGDGLAVAAALEEESYPISDLIYDLADLDAGFRFCGDDSNRWGGRLAEVCRVRYGIQSIPGYLENGVPPKYGAGAERVVAAIHQDPADKYRWVTVSLGLGDIDRIIIEWRSLLRRIAHAPELEAARWRELQAAARRTLNETESPTATDLPPLEFSQTRRIDHRLQLRRH